MRGRGRTGDRVEQVGKGVDKKKRHYIVRETEEAANKSQRRMKIIDLE